jgi:uncharacterized lipoprotein YddW (UPF0748 family)
VSAALCLASAAAAQRSTDLARGFSVSLGAQGRLMWIDGTANLFRTIKDKNGSATIDYTTTREGVADAVRRCRAAHINTLVVDVKPVSGQVLYNSKIAPRMKEWKGRRVPDFDVLAAFVEEGHKAGLQVDASINILSEGHKYYSVGPAYAHPDWQSVVYTVDRGIVAPDDARLSVRVPDEPDDPDKPPILTDEDAIMGGEANRAMVGLESEAREKNLIGGAEGTPFGKQVNFLLDSTNRVTGIVDSALLGDEPLTAPEGGRLVPATRDADRAWISQHLRPGSILRFDQRVVRTPIAQAPSEQIACFVNPLNQDVRRYELDLVRELVSNYAIDGLVLDRCRFSNLYNDFSNQTRAAFERWLGRPVSRWPEEIFAFALTPGDDMTYGKLFRPWLEFRAQVIRDFVADVARTARALKPNLLLGTYVGSWYPSYYAVGVNWGSEKTGLRYPWFTPDYPRTGYAEFFDWVCTGCYYSVPTREDARRDGQNERETVEYAADLSSGAVANGAFVYAGVNAPDYIGRPDAFLRALDAAARQTQGWMIFDLTYINRYDWWSALERAFPKDVLPPDNLPELLSTVRTGADGLQ